MAIGVGSGLSILGGLLSGARVVAVCASKSHQKFVMANLATWLKEKRVVPGTALAKPQQLVQYEAKRGRAITPRPQTPAPVPKSSPPTPQPNASPGAATTPPVSNGGTPTPSNGSGSNGSAANGGPGRNLLASFGNVACEASFDLLRFSLKSFVGNVSMNH